MKVYILILQDRHFDTETIPFATLDAAIAEGVRQLDECARHWDERRPDDPAAAGKQMNASMQSAGWRWYLRTYDDGPSARVVERELQS